MRTKWLLTSLSALLVLGLVVVPLAAAGKGPRVKNGIVNACLETKGKKSERGTIRVVNSPRQCKKRKGEQALTWALAGTAGNGGGTDGAAGPQGPVGPQGATGATGAAGERGAQGESGAAATIETKLKETITTQAKEIEDLAGHVVTLTGEVLGLERELENTIDGVRADLGSFEATTNQSIATVQATAEAGKELAKEALDEIAPLQDGLAGQCSSLGEVVTQANGLGGALGELLGVGAVKTLLGGLLPKVPAETTPVTC
ncbi:MAG TPA: hypothetical protein VHB53_09225 [Solirubrobacterales bacterium]|nr:hypothetical protein [Solirubrobacterales bacterium]